MGIFENVLIVSDIDGTFLGSDKKPVERNITAIRSFIREGGRFTFATGRVHGTLLRSIPMAPEIVNAPAIVANGSYLYDIAAESVIAADYLDASRVIGAISLARNQYPEIGIRVSTSKGFLAFRVNGFIRKDLNSCVDSIKEADLERFSSDGWYKVVFRGESDLLDVFRAEIEVRWPGQFNIVKSEPTFLELQNYGCSKASMLAQLRAYCSAKDGKAPTVYAVGDYENDYEMLLAADVAVCPTNAMPMVREIADLSPASNDEGVIGALIEEIARRMKK